MEQKASPGAMLMAHTILTAAGTEWRQVPPRILDVPVREKCIKMVSNISGVLKMLQNAPAMLPNKLILLKLKNAQKLFKNISRA